MKKTALSLIIASTVLTGCADTTSAVADRKANEVAPLANRHSVWWDPLTYNWSVLWPGNWFTAQMQVNDHGVAELNGQTRMDQSTISNALGNNYHLRQVMSIEQGNQQLIRTSWQAMKNNKVQLIIRGDNTINKIEVTQPGVKGPEGARIGSLFSEVYTKAFAVCQPESASRSVICRAPSSKHVYYVYTGESDTPDGMMPPDTLLRDWHLQTIIWQK